MSWTRLSDFTFTFHFHILEKEMATHSSVLAWRIPWTEEPGRLQSMGSLGVRHDWATSLSLFTFLHWRGKWQPTPVFLPGESQGWGSLVGCRLWGGTESDTTEATLQQQQQQGLRNLFVSHLWLFLSCQLLFLPLLSQLVRLNGFPLPKSRMLSESALLHTHVCVCVCLCVHVYT